MQRLGRRLQRSFLSCAVLVLASGTVCTSAMGAKGDSDRAALEAALQMKGAIGGVPIITGERWQKMSHDEKFYFVSGMATVVGIENALMSRFPSLMVDNFSKKAGEGALGKTAESIIERVDRFYQEHSDKLSEPVMFVIWDTAIRPRLATGIAGRKLK
jgi:hypothetical protein